MTRSEFDAKIAQGEPVTMGDIYCHDEGWDESTRRAEQTKMAHKHQSSELWSVERKMRGGNGP